jgi:MoaA/NifB/PqqE/SkfB family radical SAM enzyme
MCQVWRQSAGPLKEIGIDVIQKLPQMFFVNITGGEPFMRQDLLEIMGTLRKKSKRIVISTNGYFTDKIIDLCKRFPDVGIRISIEGLAKTNDEIRGITNGFDRSLRTLLELQCLRVKDIGFAMTLQDLNSDDLIPLYLLSRDLGCEFATASVHNSHYFHKFDNKIENIEKVNSELKRLIKLLLMSRKMKEWFRAYFNYGLINYIKGNVRLLPCEMGRNGFFLDTDGDVLVCNGMDEKKSLGNLKEQSWDEIWNGQRAREVRQMVKDCKKKCWMIGSVAPAIWHHPVRPILWVLKNKINLMIGKELDFCQRL